ncbi:helix-turn-helix domain-containing protein [Polaromonas sp. CG_9.11]|uniref:helix-turn-helix domain-containing protein n=1 Tax=Polaromonas sp. CG_9.11 TaxID=2787730 RepID=UPI0018C9061C|nr:helix-turn-helix transcriptional regulator [Polaromonas sp. CG_9.11]MBG6078229.1 transcriptional regulator with XRE-family HTH domain [Polaromonas sp. CG_9.11]
MHLTKHPTNNFPAALKDARTSLSLAQEAFSLASSRTYVSSLERGIKSPTLSKVDTLADVLGIHPLTLLMLSYLEDRRAESAEALMALVAQELRLVLRESNSGKAVR